jgi:hypothetical protein
MKNLMMLIIILFMNLPAWAMTSLEDIDLSEVSHPQSLGVVTEVVVDNAGDTEETRSVILKKFYKNSKKKSMYSLSLLEINEPLDVNDTIENDEAESKYLLSPAEKSREQVQQQRSLLIDQINGKYLQDMVASEDNTDTTVTTGKETAGTHTLAYPDGNKNSSKNTYSYRVIFNNTEMRDTFINTRNTDIRSGSWVDIKVR